MNRCTFLAYSLVGLLAAGPFGGSAQAESGLAGDSTAVFLAEAAAGTHDHEPVLRDLVATRLRTVAEDPAVIAAVEAQNSENQGVTSTEIDRLDKQWRAETQSADKPLISQITGKPLSNYLRGVKEQAAGLITEIIVMDNKGLNVGVSDVTSDYWQGDEDKWINTFPAGPNAIFVDGIEVDESTQTLQSQVSFSVVDPATNAVIGAITFGIDMEALGG